MGCRCSGWEDPEKPVLTQTSISTFSCLLFGQNLYQVWLLPANYSCHSLLNQPVKFSYQSLLRFLLKSVHIFFPVFPLPSLPCADCHGFVSTWDHKLQRPWPRPCESTHPQYQPHFHSRQTLSVDCIPIAWSCPLWYHTFPYKDGYLKQQHVMFGFYSFCHLFRPMSFPKIKSHYGLGWLNECS